MSGPSDAASASMSAWHRRVASIASGSPARQRRSLCSPRFRQLRCLGLLADHRGATCQPSRRNGRASSGRLPRGCDREAQARVLLAGKAGVGAHHHHLAIVTPAGMLAAVLLQEQAVELHQPKDALVVRRREPVRGQIAVQQRGAGRPRSRRESARLRRRCSAQAARRHDAAPPQPRGAPCGATRLAKVWPRHRNVCHSAQMSALNIS